MITRRQRASPPIVNGNGAQDASPASASAVTSNCFYNLLFQLRFPAIVAIFCAVYYISQTSNNKWDYNSNSNSNYKWDDLPILPRPPSPKFILTTQDEFTPRICWLMSFPNSGTSFTMTMAARASNKSFASNYGEEVTHRDMGDSISIYPRRPEGPYWVGTSGKMATPRALPDTFVLTKTHCSSRCLRCGPEEYVETPGNFLKECASGHGRVGPKWRRVDVEYPPSRVGKAIHLIRNPMHNIIARFHLDHRHRSRKSITTTGSSNYTNWLETHPNSAQGMQEWCKELDMDFKGQDKKFYDGKIYPKLDYAFVRTVPCHGEFFKYTQWHNLVHEGLDLISTSNNDPVPILTVYYEAYNQDFNSTVDQVLEFLELKKVGVLREFTSRSDYGGYFSKDQLNRIQLFMQRVASDKTWDEIKHYFDQEQDD
jgi:hypothetical protein